MDKGACPAVFLCQPRHDLRFTLSSNADSRLRCASGHAEGDTHIDTHTHSHMHALHIFDNMEKYLNNEYSSGNSEVIYYVCHFYMLCILCYNTCNANTYKYNICHVTAVTDDIKRNLNVHCYFMNK